MMVRDKSQSVSGAVNSSTTAVRALISLTIFFLDTFIIGIFAPRSSTCVFSNGVWSLTYRRTHSFLSGTTFELPVLVLSVGTALRRRPGATFQCWPFSVMTVTVFLL